jgi:MFS family permease
MSTESTVRPVPAWSWPAAILFGISLATIIATSAAWFYRDSEVDRFLIFLIFLLACLAPGIAAGWIAFVARFTVPKESSREHNVETSWHQRAATGAFLVVNVFVGVSLLVLSVIRVETVPTQALALLLVVGWASYFIGNAIFQRRES